MKDVSFEERKKRERVKSAATQQSLQYGVAATETMRSVTLTALMKLKIMRSVTLLVRLSCS